MIMTVHTRKPFTYGAAHWGASQTHTACNASINFYSFYKYYETPRRCDPDVMVLLSNYVRFQDNIFALNTKILTAMMISWVNPLNLELKIGRCYLSVTSIYLHFTWVYGKNLVLKDMPNFGFIAYMT